jgi:hypothetical protein
MTIRHLLKTRVVIERLQEVDNDRSAMTTVTASIGHIQPQLDDKRQLEDGVYGKQFKVYMDAGVDVQQGDRVEDEDGFQYTVVSAGVNHRDFGSIDYKVVIVEQTK